MKIFIGYGTTEGHTRKIVKAIAAQIKDMGHDATVFDTAGLLGDTRPEHCDKVILAGSVHENRHQESVEIFAVANRRKLADIPTLFISVSLAAAFENGMAEAQSYVDSFCEETQWQPDQTLLVAGAVKHGEYGFYREQYMQHIVLGDRDLLDPEADHELTDWEALAKDIKAFVEG
jgi:menaquinone-dependent protoporphyrinogen oxidase